MRFRIYEDLEQDLKIRADEQKRIIDEVRSKLKIIDFKEKKDINGISFDLTQEGATTDQRCQFYIDTNDNSYSCYIARTEPYEKVNYSQEGELIKAVSAVEDFIKNVEGFDYDE